MTLPNGKSGFNTSPCRNPKALDPCPPLDAHVPAGGNLAGAGAHAHRPACAQQCPGLFPRALLVRAVYIAANRSRALHGLRGRHGSRALGFRHDDISCVAARIRFAVAVVQPAPPDLSVCRARGLHRRASTCVFHARTPRLEAFPLGRDQLCDGLRYASGGRGHPSAPPS